MLSLHVVRGDGYRYYVDDLVPGRAEGARVAGESPGVWSGGGAAHLGLEGRVGRSDFRDVLDGLDPRSRAVLRRPYARRSVAGYDLTFGAPKSVSLLHLLAPGEIAAQVGAGHHAAVDEAIAYLGRTAVGVRRSRGGSVTPLPTTGAVAAQFVHRTSRALDPHLHTHVVLANVTQGVDGGWSALDGRRLFLHAPAVQGIYHARLRFELTDRLGAAWQVGPSGLGDVVGVDARIRRLFSTRTASMDEYDQQLGRSAGRRRRSAGAFHGTRPDKDRLRSVEAIGAEWRRRAADAGYDLGDLTRAVGLGRRSGGTDAARTFDPGRLRARLGGLAERRGTLFPHDLVALVAASTRSGAPAAVVESVAGGIGEACARSSHQGGAGSDWSSDPRLRGAGIVESRWASAEVVRVLEHDADRLLDRGHDVPGMLRGSSGRVGPGGLVVAPRSPAHRTVEVPALGRSGQLGR